MIIEFNITEEYKDWWSIEIIDNKGRVNKAFVGTFTQMVIYAVVALQFNIEEIDLAVQEMCKNNHNVANFGRYSTFILTSHKDIFYRKAS